MDNKYYFFKDKNCDDNLLNGLTYYSQGVVDKIFNEKETHSGKDLSCRYIHPFTLEKRNVWRTYSEVDLFEVIEEEWKQLIIEIDLNN